MVAMRSDQFYSISIAYEFQMVVFLRENWFTQGNSQLVFMVSY